MLLGGGRRPPCWAFHWNARPGRDARGAAARGSVATGQLRHTQNENRMVGTRKTGAAGPRLFPSGPAGPVSVGAQTHGARALLPGP